MSNPRNFEHDKNNTCEHQTKDEKSNFKSPSFSGTKFPTSVKIGDETKLTSPTKIKEENVLSLTYFISFRYKPQKRVSTCNVFIIPV